MRNLAKLVCLLALLAPATSSAAMFCPTLTDDMWLRSCDEGLDEDICARYTTGDQVSQLQRFLTDYYHPATNMVTGYFGNRTRNLVQEFQMEHGLPISGQVRTFTRARIAEVCGAPRSTEQGYIEHGAWNNAQRGRPVVSCAITAFPPMISKGESATISWTSTNATDGLITTLGSVKPNGIEITAPTRTTIYSGLFWSMGLQPAQCQATLTVREEPQTGTAVDGHSTTNGSGTSTAMARCNWLGQSLAHGESIVAYQAASVAYGQTCVSERRTCSNGVLSGSYGYQQCSVAPRDTVFSPGRSCTTPWGATVAHGSSVAAYQAANATQCVSQQRTCTDGVLSGTYTYATCAVSNATTTYDGGTFTIATPLTADKTSGSAPLTVTFTRSVVVDNAYPSIDFGDGSAPEPATSVSLLPQSSALSKVTHTYASPGTYTAVARYSLGKAVYEGKVQITVVSIPPAR